MSLKISFFAVTALGLLCCFSGAASAQSGTSTTPSGPWGTAPLSQAEINPLGNFHYGNPYIYGNPPYGLGTWGPGAQGMFANDVKKAITPRLVAGVTPEETEQRTAELFRSRINIEATANTLRSHISEQQKKVARLTTKLQSAEQKKESTDQIRAEIATEQNDNRLFRQALESNTKNLESVNRSIERLGKSQQTDKSQGWVLVDTVSEKGKKEKALPLECSQGQRLVSRLQYGTVASFGCLDSKGYLMKESAMILNPYAYNSPTTTVYERDGENIKSITHLDKDGKPTFEKTFSTDQETHKYFDKGSVQSSCTYYGAEGSRAQGGAAGRQGISR